MSQTRRLFVILGDQLFEPRLLGPPANTVVFMAEDLGLCQTVRHHQQKLVLFLAAMRHHADALRAAGFEVCYRPLLHDEAASYEQQLHTALRDYRCDRIEHFEIEERPMEQRIRAFAEATGLERRELPSPMFLCSRESFAQFAAGSDRLLQADFYRLLRRRLRILLEGRDQPAGGRWSFDTQNRRKLPRGLEPPSIRWAASTPHVADVQAIVARYFADHPGDAAQFAWPVTREAARAWLAAFVAERLANFGPFEDAISSRSDALFHSLLSPLLNIGLITPREVVDAALAAARQREVPLASLEGFVRQVIGWREFVRGVYRELGSRQEQGNFFGHHRLPGPAWLDGTTGIEPLDASIRRALRLGWSHHIERLMVVGNLMTLCEISPPAAWRWFMEMYVDSSEWVMGPNVYGMALHSDGGLFATKPYICGSNYIRKMSDYGQGPWCEIVDGLYWRFVARHRDYLGANPRTAPVARAFERLAQPRRERLFAAAEGFLAAHTIAGAASTARRPPALLANC